MSCSANNIDGMSNKTTEKKLSSLKSEASSSSRRGKGPIKSCTGKDSVTDEIEYSEDPIESNEIVKIKKRIISSHQRILNLPEEKISELYCEQTGPQIYNVPKHITSKNTIVKNLPEVFSVLPVTGKPNNETRDQYEENKILEFLNIELTAEEFKNVIKYCSPDHLRTGKEIDLPLNSPFMNFTSFNVEDFRKPPEPKSPLYIHRNYKINLETDAAYSKHFKYRRVRLLPLPTEEPMKKSDALEPGKDLIFQIKLYRPYPYNSAKLQSIRHSVCVCDVILHGDQPLTMLRDRIACTNDLDMRVDVSDKLEEQPKTTAKQIFPSGFLFISNVFYVDRRPGCKDITEVIRRWAFSKGLGNFPCKDMGSVVLKDLVLRLGYPEVYVHLGNCEHLFTFSDIRLASTEDPLNKTVYPFFLMVSSNQNAYCASCAEFCAKWVVKNSSRVPFDPAYFCDTCLKLYMYIDGKKIGNFKAYSFKGNDVHLFKPAN